MDAPGLAFFWKQENRKTDVLAIDVGCATGFRGLASEQILRRENPRGSAAPGASVPSQNSGIRGHTRDVGRAAAGNRTAYFVCNLGVGFNGMVNGEARKTRWLRGLPLYAWAFVKSMVKHFDKPTMTIRFDEAEVTAPTLALSVLNGQREGNFPLRPSASLTDGFFDYMHATRLSRWHLVRYLAGDGSRANCRRITHS